MKNTIASISMETGVQRGCLPREVCLFYFIFLKTIKNNPLRCDILFSQAHSRCQTEPNFIFLENRMCCSVCRTFQHVTFNQFYVQMGYSPMKIFRKRGNCFKRSIKYYYIESHSVENLPNQPPSFRATRNQRICVKWENPSLPTRGLREA